MKAWPVIPILVIQVILLLAHWFIYLTVVAFWPGLAAPVTAGLHASLLVLAFTFVVATLLSFRYANPAVRLFYWLAAVWLGFLNFFFWASCIAWIGWFVFRLSHLAGDPLAIRHVLAASLYAAAALMGLYGLINARIVRVRRFTIQLPNLPASWRGRRAVLMSDLHLGPINGVRFCRRMVALAARFEPDVVFIPGDLFDGAHTDLDRLLTPFQSFVPPKGIYFSTGNHEEFSDPTPYIEAIKRAGIRVLANQAVNLDGLTVAGVLYHDSTHIIRMKAFLDGLNLDRAAPCILLNHAPARLPIVEQAGVSLQLSGHTHGGQFLPFTWITQRVYGRFTRGLHRFGSLQVYTSTGAGTWGPPMRVGTRPEIIVLEFS
ncbi:MAG TPA: metallophosphoesterase [Terracidiphilus sp.]